MNPERPEEEAAQRPVCCGGWLGGCTSAADDVIKRKPSPSCPRVQQTLYPQCGTFVTVSLLPPASGVLLPGAHFSLSLKDKGNQNCAKLTEWRTSRKLMSCPFSHLALRTPRWSKIGKKGNLFLVIPKKKRKKERNKRKSK